jgi:gamma-glutamyltranspeptidase/glutathione hydrolase
MSNIFVSTSSGTYAAQAGREILVNGGSAADAVAAASMVQIVDAAGTYVSFAGMMVALYYEASTGKVFSINGDYGVPTKKQGENLTSLYAQGKLGVGVLIPGYFGGIRELLARFGKLPWEKVISPAIERCDNRFPPYVRLIKRLRKRSLTNPPSVETFTMENGEVVQKDLGETLLQIKEAGIDTMYSGSWGQKFVETVQTAGGVIDIEDMLNYRAQISEAISIQYKDHTVFASPPENAGGLITLLILSMVERLNLKETGHFTKNADAFIQLISGMRVYMPFLHKIMGNFDDAAFKKALGGRAVNLEDALLPETIDTLWDAIRRGEIDTVPIEKPNNTDVVVAVDGLGNIAILVHSACATTGRDGLVVAGISLPRMAAEFPAGAETSKKWIPGIFSPIISISKEKILAVAAIHASLYEKQSAVLLNVLEYGLPLSEANDLPTPLYPDYGQEGQVSEVLSLDQYDPSFLDALKQRGLRFINVRESGLGKFVGEENLDAVESPLIGVEINRADQTAAGVTCKHYDGKVLTGISDPNESAL